MIMDDDDYFIKNKLNIVLKLLKDNENFNSVNCFAFGTIIKKKIKLLDVYFQIKYQIFCL